MREDLKERVKQFIKKSSKNTALKLENTKVTADDLTDIVAWLNQAPFIISLSLRFNGLFDQDIRPLADLQHIKFLDLGHNNIGDNGLTVLIENRIIDALDLSYNSITKVGATLLRDSGHFSSLNLDYKDEISNTVDIKTPAM